MWVKGTASRFSGFDVVEKPLKRLSAFASFNTGLKPGVNESNTRTLCNIRDRGYRLCLWQLENRARLGLRREAQRHAALRGRKLSNHHNFGAAESGVAAPALPPQSKITTS